MLWRAGWSVKWSATATLLYAMIMTGIILAAALAAACGGPEPSPIDSASSAEEILAEAEAAMAQVESFASVYEWTIGDTETVTTENEFQDERNYRKTRSMSTEGVLFIGPSEVAVVDGETFWNSADTWSDSPPAYAFPSDLGDIERLDDTMLEGARVHHLRGSRPPQWADRERCNDVGLDVRHAHRRRHAPAGPLRGQDNPYVPTAGGLNRGTVFRGLLCSRLWPLRRGFQHCPPRPDTHANF